MKKFLCLLIVCCLMPVGAFAQTISETESAKQIAEGMGIIPESVSEDWEENITREEFVALAINSMAYNLDYEYDEFAEYVKTVDKRLVSSYRNSEEYFTTKKKDSVVTFADCDNSKVLLAADMGIVQGREDGKFYPDEFITKEDIAIIITRMVNLCSSSVGYASVPFEDEQDISPWAKKSALCIKSSGVMADVYERFCPKDFYSRNMAVMAIVELSYKDFWKKGNGAYVIRPTLERIIERYNNHPIYEVKETIETQYGTLLVIVSGGAMHTGGQSLVFVTNDSEEISFSKDVPYDTPWGQSHYKTMELTEDGSKLVYTYSFDEQAVHTDSDGEIIAVLHEKGSYVFTADLTTGEVTYVFTSAE